MATNDSQAQRDDDRGPRSLEDAAFGRIKDSELGNTAVNPDDHTYFDHGGKRYMVQQNLPENYTVYELGPDGAQSRVQDLGGTPMESEPGSVMRYSTQPSTAGAQIIRPNGSQIDFGGADAIDKYAGESGLTQAEIDTLKRFDEKAQGRNSPVGPSPGDVDRVAAFEGAAKQAQEFAGEGRQFHGDSAADVARVDVKMLNEIEDDRLRMQAAGHMATIAESHPDYKAALLANHRMEAQEVAGHARFVVASQDTDGKRQVLHFGNDADAAVKQYVANASHEDVSKMSAGGNVTLTDAQLKLDAARVSEGKGGTIEKFGKAEGREAVETARAEPQAGPASPAAPDLALTDADLARLDAVRSRDSEKAREAMGLNTIEPGYEREMKPLEGEAEAKRAAWLSKAKEAPAPAVAAPEASNKLESDEIFTGGQADRQALVPQEIERQFVRKGDKFYNQPDASRLEFQDRGNKLETRSDGERVAEALVRIAEARGWDEIKVKGSDAFRREAWMEAAARGMHVKGYLPTEQDKEALAKRTGKVPAKEVADEAKPASQKAEERAKEAESPGQRKAREFTADRNAAARTHPELVGAAAAAAVVNRRVEESGLSPEQQATVKARVHRNIVNSIERGNPPEVKIKEEREVTVEIEPKREMAR